MDARSTASFLTRATAVLAGLFFMTSIGLAILAGTHSGAPRSLVLDGAPTNAAPVGQHGAAPAVEDDAPAQPTVPTVPTN